MTAIDRTSRSPRFGRLIERRDGRDFPFYNSEPTEVALWKWALIVISCAAGLAALLFVPSPNNVVGLIPRLMFPAIPLATFILFTGQYWTSIFRGLGRWDYLDMVIFWLLNLVVSGLLGLIVLALFGANPNPATDSLAQAGPIDIFAFYLGTGIQLFGEEVFTILPFIAVMYLFFTKVKLSRNASVILAWLITAAWFGAAHLPTYDWNFAQAFIIIGGARLVLTLAFIRTKNILVSTGAHILNDWSSFTIALVTAAAISG